MGSLLIAAAVLITSSNVQILYPLNSPTPKQIERVFSAEKTNIVRHGDTMTVTGKIPVVRGTESRNMGFTLKFIPHKGYSVLSLQGITDHAGSVTEPVKYLSPEDIQIIQDWVNGRFYEMDQT